MLIKYIKIILINILLFLNFSVKADTLNYIVGNDKKKINQRIDNLSSLGGTIIVEPTGITVVLFS